MSLSILFSDATFYDEWKKNNVLERYITIFHYLAGLVISRLLLAFQEAGSNTCHSVVSSVMFSFTLVKKALWKEI